MFLDPCNSAGLQSEGRQRYFRKRGSRPLQFCRVTVQKRFEILCEKLVLDPCNSAGLQSIDYRPVFDPKCSRPLQFCRVTVQQSTINNLSSSSNCRMSLSIILSIFTPHKLLVVLINQPLCPFSHLRVFLYNKLLSSGG